MHLTKIHGYILIIQIENEIENKVAFKDYIKYMQYIYIMSVQNIFRKNCTIINSSVQLRTPKTLLEQWFKWE